MRSRKTRFFSTAVLAIGMMTLLSSCPLSLVFVKFNDPALEAIIKDKLGLRLTPVTSVDMLGLFSLDISGVGINDLTGLEYAVAMNFLDASSNPISDLRPLKTCISLRTLNLADTEVFEVSPLMSLNNLRTLDLCGNAVPNLQPLLENSGFLGGGATGTPSLLTVDCELVPIPEMPDMTGSYGSFGDQFRVFIFGADGMESSDDDNTGFQCNCEDEMM